LVHHVSALDFVKETPQGACQGLVLVLIPAFNEAENLKAVLPRIPKETNACGLKVLVVNDGSTDDTEAVCRRHGAWVVSHPTNYGGGVALRTGFYVARHLEVSVVVTMDGDGQHDPAEIPRLVDPILQGNADLVIGSRVLGNSETYSAFRSTGVRVFSSLINTLMGTRVTDCSSGFRALRQEALGDLRLAQDQYHTAEMIIEAAKNGRTIIEAPINISQRLSGRSKKGHDLLYGFKFFFVVVRSWLR
jgi:glycosyltransferase involved in cell wall biosynthesis